MERPEDAAVGFIGAGRVARTLALRWSRAGIPVVAVCSRTPESARALASLAPGCLACAAPQDVADLAELIFVTVPDDAIEAAIGGARFARDRAVIHCSGACELEVLRNARAQGAAIGGFHPLQLFPTREAGAVELAGCAVAIEAEGPLRRSLERLARALGCDPISLPPGARRLYHVGANYAASFVLCLMQEAVQLWQSAGIDARQAASALMPLLQGTVAAAARNGLAGSLSGPVSRGDASTVRAHVEALSLLPGDHLLLYSALMRRAISLGREKGLPGRVLADLEKALDEPLQTSRKAE